MKSNILYILILAIIVSCANPLPPPGGPKDMVLPAIIETVPETGTLNFQSKKITLTFNKYMNKSEVIENVFISPETPFTYSWSGKTLRIELKGDLKESATYTLSLGTDYSDYYARNKPAEAFSLVFSTGDAIDSGQIQGKLFAEKTDGAYIFCYYLSDMDKDTLNFSSTKPDYFTQVGSNGYFKIQALKDGEYRLFAIRDLHSNRLYDALTDDFGAYIEDVKLVSDSIPFLNLKLGTPLDSLKVQLYGLDQVSNRIVEASFSKDLDTFSISSKSFILSDSSEQNFIKISSAFLNSKQSVLIVTEAPLQKGKKYKLTCLRDSNSIKDEFGNSISNEKYFSYFVSNGLELEIEPKLIKLPFADSSFNVPYEQEFNFIFNMGIKEKDIAKRIKLIRLSDSLDYDFDFSFPAENIIRISPKQLFMNFENYVLSFFADSLLFCNDKKFADTSINLRFQTIDKRTWGAISGRVDFNLDCTADLYLVLESKKDKSKYIQKLDENLEWEFTQIPTGEYQVEVFCDKNGNSKYDYGKASPFSFSEPFYISPELLIVKARWRVENIILQKK